MGFGKVFAEARAERVRVRLYPQSPLGGGGARLETVVISPRRGALGPGPSDSRMYAIEAPGKRPYGHRDGARDRPSLPPWSGATLPAARPGPDGHLDHLRPGDPGFRCAHLYGCARFALDVWEKYLRRRIPWHFSAHFQRLELVALGDWANAHMGYGYLEAGMRRLPDGRVADLALDFDVIAHEIGHALMMAFGGPFTPERVSPDYQAFHEASADWAALIAVLHFDSVVEEVMETAEGDLDGVNRLSRFAEFSRTRQIRLANNDRTMWDFARGWRSEHDLALPLIAGLFDAFMRVYHDLLISSGALPQGADSLARSARVDCTLRHSLRLGYRRAFAKRPELFYDALYEAREIAAAFLIGLWRRAEPATFRFSQLPVFAAEIDRAQFGGRLWPVIDGAFSARGVGVVPPGPRLRRPDSKSHFHSARTFGPG